MNKEFIVGKYYKLRPDYPLNELVNTTDRWFIQIIDFEGRTTTWVEKKLKVNHNSKLLILHSYEDNDGGKIQTRIRFDLDNEVYDFQFNPEDFMLINDLDETINKYNKYVIGEKK